MKQMRTLPVRITHIGGPTALIEIGQLRLLTNPTFDPAGSRYGPIRPASEFYNVSAGKP